MSVMWDCLIELSNLPDNGSNRAIEHFLSATGVIIDPSDLSSPADSQALNLIVSAIELEESSDTPSAQLDIQTDSTTPPIVNLNLEF